MPRLVAHTWAHWRLLRRPALKNGSALLLAAATLMAGWWLAAAPRASSVEVAARYHARSRTQRAMTGHRHHQGTHGATAARGR